MSPSNARRKEIAKERAIENKAYLVINISHLASPLGTS
jgi:hypothetical protein